MQQIYTSIVRCKAYPGSPVDRLRGATRRALIALVDLALREKVDLVLLAGDIFDRDLGDFHRCHVLSAANGSTHKRGHASYPAAYSLGRPASSDRLLEVSKDRFNPRPERVDESVGVIEQHIQKS